MHTVLVRGLGAFEMAQSGIDPGTLKWAAISGATFIISFILISCVLPRMFSSVDWTLKLRLKTAERINSSIHSTCATIVAGHFLYQQLFNIGHMQYDAVNPQSMEYALAMSMGYFLADTFVMWFQYTLQFEDAPVTFTAHHGVCISYILGVLHLGVGFQTAVVAWFCGEVGSFPCCQVISAGSFDSAADDEPSTKCMVYYQRHLWP